MLPNLSETICAIATPPGTGAIAVLRISGPETFPVMEKIFRTHQQKDFSQLKPRTTYFGVIKDDTAILDEVVSILYRAPHSYTGEDAAEIMCHGSGLIQRQIIALLNHQGIRMAQGGEFTLRGFQHGKFDLAQAEAVADLIAADSKAAHDLALKQMRGGYSAKILELRTKLVRFSALIELELDFSEEEVEFADRTQLSNLLSELKDEIIALVASFAKGNVMKKGIPVAIIGKPNTGKSTLLNALLNEEKAIVSAIPGTTRDVIEDTIIIDGFSFRFLDTAGLRQSDDTIENLGIERTVEAIKQAQVILHVFDISETNPEALFQEIAEFKAHLKDTSRKWILIGNKTDKLAGTPKGFPDLVELETLFVCAKRKENIHLITTTLSRMLADENISENTIVSSARHYEALMKTLEAVESVEQGFEQQLPSDLIATDIRRALHFLGTITGQISTNEILNSIFEKFCIGK
ncbi:MAG: tRNA uridine-5-carboxymethylaminomethyl(34) synthesis GTPase MnmE [Bacteroidia bacterium]|nr:tRNA uridine-5-carboxymethylaminomethyl(34) synthesis GTPase MnmE [Bacteroidia bacterium]